MKPKKIFTAALCAAMTMSLINITPLNVYAEEENSMEIVIDGSKANTKEIMLYRGPGMVSANNSSRLLLDYKSENSEAYWEIMNYIFSDKGVGINHLKVEMGSDINSSSGTEPSVKRSEDEKADVKRGAGYQLAADAKTINPDLTLDMLWWSEPKWVSDSEDLYAARYKWYKETLDAAYDTYGIKFDYVSAVQNEKPADLDWIKYLSKSLKSESNTFYDYSKIKVVAGEEVCTWNIADKMLADEELMNSIDVVGSHYTSWSTDNAKKLADEYGKELWFSEGSTSMSYSQGTHRFDGTGTGMTDINGILDIANRFITMYPGGHMTLCQYQPVISAYYDGVTYAHKQFINACDPWSGYYYLDSGFYMSLHFSQFIKKGWAFIDDACYADGVAGGDGHAVVDATYSYITATDTATDDYSTVITNTTANPITYNFTVSNLDKASSAVNVWETKGPDGGSYDENYFKNIDTITPVSDNGVYKYSVTVNPYSIVSVSTVELTDTDYINADESKRTVLSLPYTDDYEYGDYPADYLSSRGYAPRYSTDEGGAFEVQNVDGNNILTQLITPETKAKEWGGTPDPTTNFGDDRWFNYSVTVDTKFTPSETPEKNYVGAGLRYNLAAAGVSGYWIQVYEDGTYKLNKNKIWLLAEGKIDNFDNTAWNNLKIEAFENKVNAYVNGELLVEYEASGESMLSAGRAALYSSYNQNSYDNLMIEPIEGYDTYITRFDQTDYLFDYTGNWSHTTMSSFRNYKRTISSGSENASFTLNFEGTGFNLTGENKADNVISVKIDGEEVEAAYTIPVCASRESAYHIYGLENKAHTAEITVKTGTFNIDGAEIIGGKVYEPSEETEVIEQPEETTSETVTETSAVESKDDNITNKSEKSVESRNYTGAIIAGAVAVIGVIGAFIFVKKRKK